MRAADWIIRRLADEGIKHIFLLPGGGAMHLNDALACETRIEPIPCHHEQACGIAAEAYGRTAHPENPGFGVAMVTTGPGATNIITPVAGAWIDSVPMLVLSGQVKRADRLAGRPIRQGGVQEVDIIPMVSSVTKYAVTLDDPQLVRFHLEQALYLMKSGRPGPVWLDIPLDVQAAPIDPETLPNWVPPQSESIDSATAVAQIQSVANMLATAKRPLILAGHGVRLAGAAQAFEALIEKLQIPAVLTWNALDLLPYDHPLNIGRPGVVATRAANFAVQNCDLLIAIGARLDHVVTAYNPKGFARAARKVVVDIDPHELDNKVTMGIELPLALDARFFIESLTKSANTVDVGDWRSRCLDWKTRYTQNEGKVFPDEGPISHAHFVEAFSAAAPNNTLIATGSSGLAIEFFYAGFHNKAGQRTFLTSGLGSMGYGLSTAIGACLGNARQPILALESDGSFQLNLQELATLVHLNLPIALFIMNNNGYASIRNTQRNYFNSRYIASNPESGLFMPNFEKIAMTYGINYCKIQDCSNLTDTVKNIIKIDKPCLVEVSLTNKEILEPKCAAMHKSDGSLFSMPLEDMSPLLEIEQLKSEMEIPLLIESYVARNKIPKGTI